MLKFSPTLEILAAASCVDQDKSKDINDPCRLTTDFTWDCACFQYTFAENDMYWRSYSKGGGDGGKNTPIRVAEHAENNNFVFQPLPLGLFSSKPSSQFRFAQKSAMLFAETQCAEKCGLPAVEDSVKDDDD